MNHIRTWSSSVFGGSVVRKRERAFYPLPLLNALFVCFKWVKHEPNYEKKREDAMRNINIGSFEPLRSSGSSSNVLENWRQENESMYVYWQWKWTRRTIKFNEYKLISPGMEGSNRSERMIAQMLQIIISWCYGGGGNRVLKTYNPNRPNEKNRLCLLLLVLRTILRFSTFFLVVD